MSGESKLTPEQIVSWRKVLLEMFGSFVNFLSDKEIQSFKDNLQNQVDKLPSEDEKYD